jgi:hypothetical protein
VGQLQREVSPLEEVLKQVRSRAGLNAHEGKGGDVGDVTGKLGVLAGEIGINFYHSTTFSDAK